MERWPSRNSVRAHFRPSLVPIAEATLSYIGQATGADPAQTRGIMRMLYFLRRSCKWVQYLLVVVLPLMVFTFLSSFLGSDPLPRHAKFGRSAPSLHVKHYACVRNARRLTALPPQHPFAEAELGTSLRQNRSQLS